MIGLFRRRRRRIAPELELVEPREFFVTARIRRHDWTEGVKRALVDVLLSAAVPPGAPADHPTLELVLSVDAVDSQRAEQNAVRAVTRAGANCLSARVGARLTTIPEGTR